MPTSPSEPPGARLSIAEAAEYLGVTRQRILDLIRRGILPVESEGGSHPGKRDFRTVDVSDLERYRMQRGLNKKQSTGAAPEEPTATASPETAPEKPTPTASPETAPPAQTIIGVGVDTQSESPGRWRRFWDSKLGAWVAEHIFGTFIVGAIAAIVATVVAANFVGDGNRTDGPTTPPTNTSFSTPTTTTPPSSPPTVTTSPPTVAPPRQTEEGNIAVGVIGEFFDGDLLVGLNSTYRNHSDLTVTTRTLSCEYHELNVGAPAFISGNADGRDTYFRLIVLKAVQDISVSLRVENLPESEWPWSTPLVACPGA